MNVTDLQVVLGLSYSTNNSVLSENKEVDQNQNGNFSDAAPPVAAGERGDDVACVCV